MAKNDITVRELQAPQIMTTNGLSLRTDALYCDAKGREKGNLRKQADKILEQLREPLQRMLQPDESILFVARANRAFSPLEQVTAGWAAYYYSMFELVLTNRRLLQFGVDSKGKWKKSVKAVAWGDVSSVKVRAGLLSREMELRLKDGSKLKYWRLGNAQAKALKAIISAVHNASSGEASGYGVRQLCPSCFRDLTAGHYECTGCGQVFKDEQTLKRRAWLIPGGGYFYAGQTAMGALAAFVDVYLLFLVLATLLGNDAATKAEGNNPVAQAIGVTVFVLVLVGLEKLFQIYHARHAIRDFMPVGGTAAVRGIAAGMS